MKKSNGRYSEGFNEPNCLCTCCNNATQSRSLRPGDASWIIGVVNTAVGEVPQVRTSLSFSDRLGSAKARWGIGRMNYRVSPGLYAVGIPTAESPVLVSANYKMSFDRLRAQLYGRDAWIIVLDTNGINVWCAAGKGTFGTEEVVRRVQSVSLDKLVLHRRLIVPQLGATGVSAHQVRKSCGFSVIYGPVRSEDLPAFLDAGMKARPEMRKVRFGIRERAVMIPMEVVGGAKYALLLSIIFALISGLGPDGYSLQRIRTSGITSAEIIFSAFLCIALLGPILLPWLPGRAFSIKGAVLGFIIFGMLEFLVIQGPGIYNSYLHTAAYILMIPALSSFIIMNFTGATTFTSLSGVLLEIRFALPVQISAAVIGFGLWLAGLFINGGH